MITPAFPLTATERVLPSMALDFTSGVLDPRVTVSRALNTATRFNSSGLMEMVNANLPRFDYDPNTLAPKGLLIEETRVNSVLQSGFAGAVTGTPGTFPTSWTSPLAGGSISAVTTDSLGGNILTFTVSGARHIMQQVVSVAANTSYCLSLYIHSNTGLPIDDIIFAVSPPAGTTTGYYANGASVPGAYVPAAGDRVHILAVVGATAGSITWRIAAGASRTATGSVSFSRPQFEAGAFATSFIPTTTTSLTRNADFVSMTGTNFSDWYNASEGTFAVNCDTRSGHVFNANDGTSNNRIALFGQLSMFAAVGGVTQVNQAVGVTGINVLFGATMSYKLNSYLASLNGAASVSDTSATVPTVNQLSIGKDQSTTNYINGHIAKLLYWPMQLTANEVRTFSKLG